MPKLNQVKIDRCSTAPYVDRAVFEKSLKERGL